MGILKLLIGLALGAAAAVLALTVLHAPRPGALAPITRPPDAAEAKPADVFRPIVLPAEPADDRADAPVPTVEGTVKVFGSALRATGVGLAPPGVANPVQAREMAAGAAQLDALSKLAAFLTGRRLDAVRSARDYRQRRYTVTETVRAMLHGARVVATRDHDGLVEVEMEIELAGEDDDDVPPPEPVLPPETTL